VRGESENVNNFFVVSAVTYRIFETTECDHCRFDDLTATG